MILSAADLLTIAVCPLLLPTALTSRCCAISVYMQESLGYAIAAAAEYMHAQLVHDNINLTLSTIAHDASDYQTNRLYWTPNPSSFVCEPDALLSLTRLMGLWKICFHWMMLSMLRFTRVD